MMADKYGIERWRGARPLGEDDIHRILKQQRLLGFTWSNSLDHNYSAHAHPFYKVIYVLRGSIGFGLLSEGKQITLGAGDCRDLPAGAVVGSRGVVCIEAHR